MIFVDNLSVGCHASQYDEICFCIGVIDFNFMNFKKIIITGNILRFNWHNINSSNQNGNIIWLYNILRPVLLSIASIDPEYKIYERSTDINIHKIYEYQSRAVNRDGFAAIVNDTPNAKTIEYIKQVFSDALVIGFELPKIFIDCFNASNIPYIDIIIAPIRFLPDLTFGVRSNMECVNKILATYQINDDIIFRYAGIVKATLSRGGSLEIKDDACIFAGQLTDDISLIRDGKYINIKDYIDKIDSIFSHHKAVYFKPHPYASNKIIWQQYTLLNKIKKTEILDSNIYKLMTNENLSCLCALTSSVVIEAKYFEANRIMIEKYPFLFQQQKQEEQNKFFLIYDKLISYEFWGKIFQRETKEEVILPEGVIKASLGLHWGSNSFVEKNATAYKFFSKDTRDKFIYKIMKRASRYL